jgi:hypothetical protein
VLSVVVLVGSGCSPGTTRGTLAATPASCPSPPPNPAGDATRTRIGPIWIAGFDSTNPPTVSWKRGYPTKLLLQEAEPISTVLELTGWACSNGKPLRFWYHDGLPFSSLPASDEAMASAGDATAKLDFTSQPNDRTGYMLFTNSGRWVVRLATRQLDYGKIAILVVGQA